MSRSKRLVAAIGVAVAVLAVPAGAAAPKATKLFSFQDARIDEASGIAVATRSPGVVFVQNDSGDSARFFAVDEHNGKTLAVYDVPGAKNVDWEDLAVADGHVWLADIGDNNAKRSSVQLYRVDEPDVAQSGGQTRTTDRPDVWNLRYPDGPHDAETLLVDDAGHPYIVTKSIIGTSGVYEVPATPGASIQTMRRVGEVHFSLTSTPGPFGPAGHLLATGGSYGDTAIVIRTYTDAYVWDVSGDVVATLKTKPHRVGLPRQPQGEGIAIVGSSLLIDSEGVGSGVYSVSIAPLPGRHQTASTEGVRHSRTSGTTILLVLAGAGVAFFAVGFAVVGIVVLVRRRRRV